MTILGAVCLYLGSFVLAGAQVKNIAGQLTGLGAAVFCLGIGNLVSTFLISKSKNEEMARQINIEVNDERNIRIREKVGAAINRIVVYILSAIVLVLGFMGAEVFIIIMLASVLLIQLVLSIVLWNYYSKQM
jgi:uncharacterized membrane protein